MMTLTDVYCMQYGHAKYQVLREIVFAGPKLGLVYILKSDLSGGFYLIGLRPANTLKLGLVSLGPMERNSW